MRWAALILLLVNLGLAGYLIFLDRPRGAEPNLRVLEMNADKVKSLKPPASPKAQVESAKSAAIACLEWGSFTVAELERAQEHLAKLKPTRTGVRELTESSAWWVHVPPLKTREDAERRVREIEDAGVKDVRVVTEGERWRNAISLGIFKSEDAGNAYLARMKESKVRNVALVRRTDLLRLAAIVIVEPQASLIARVMELRTGFEGTEVKAAACPPGAV